jgi:hypothetical protein
MNRVTACRCLDLPENNDPIDIDVIKRQYRIKALTYHPDKNKDPMASSKFQEIHDAYEYIMKKEGHMEDDVDDNPFSYDDYDDDTSSYKNIFILFLKKILETETSNSIFYSIIQRITTLCEDKAIELLERLDKQTLLKTQVILLKYSDAFHISDTLLSKITSIIENKNEKDECIIVNPSLHDLYENNLYKLTVNNVPYIIPLWHHELIYDVSGNDLYVNCIPMLPNNIEIDDKNNVHIMVQTDIRDIWGKEFMYVECDELSIPIQVNTLKLVPTQTIIIVKKGITKINTKDIYDVSKKSDIYVTVKLHM